MKKLIYGALPTALIVLFLCCGFTTNVQAQFGPACLPDCPQSTFTAAGVLPPVDLEVPGQPGCTLRVTYGYRNACGIWHDFYIYNIQPIGNCDPNFLADVNAVVQTATNLLFMSNPPVDQNGSTVGPNRPANCHDLECVINWRVIRGSCWRDYGGIYFECQTTTCCLTPYRICRDFCDNITVENLGAPGGGVCVTGEGGCVRVCN